MPLSELVHSLNTLNSAPESWSQHNAPFFSTNGAVFIHFANLRLESQFLPIVETATGQLFGHRAVLRAYSFNTWQPVRPEAVFVMPSDDGEFVYLDRLVRTLHALNALARKIPGALVLPVHPRHVASVPNDHGMAFEEILRSCGLFPEQVTLEIDLAGVESLEHLKLAARNYHARGYRIAFSRLGNAPLDFELLEELAPNLVKIDPQFLTAVAPLRQVAERFHAMGTRLWMEGVETTSLRRGALALGIDLIQTHGTQAHFVAAKGEVASFAH